MLGRRSVIKPWGIVVGGVGVLLAAAALFLYSRHQLPQRAAALNPTMGQKLIGYSGRPLTVGRVEPVLLVMPRRLSLLDRRLVARAMKRGSLGSFPVLWQAPSRVWRQWQATAGILAVHARVEEPVAGVAKSALATYIRAAGIRPKVDWVLHGTTYQPVSLSGRARVTINPGLEARLAREVKGSQSILVVAQDGKIRATAGDWTRADRIGSAALPPLLAEALAQRSVKSALQPGLLTLSALSRIWGNRASWAVAQKLGLIESLKPKGSLLNGSTPLQVTPEQLAQSYVAFINQDQLVSLTLNAQEVPNSRGAGGDFPMVLSVLPAVDENSVLFKVWRPVGKYTVILAPTLHELAVLQGIGESGMVAVMRMMATTKD